MSTHTVYGADRAQRIQLVCQCIMPIEHMMRFCRLFLHHYGATTAGPDMDSQHRFVFILIYADFLPNIATQKLLTMPNVNLKSKKSFHQKSCIFWTELYLYILFEWIPFATFNCWTAISTYFCSNVHPPWHYKRFTCDFRLEPRVAVMMMRIFPLWSCLTVF